MTIGNPLCHKCKHFYLNVGENGRSGCKAFPDGIPDEVRGGYNHRNVLPHQVGKYVYEEAKWEELSPFAQYLRTL